MGLRFDSLCIEAVDPAAQAAWWQQVLGGEVVDEQGLPRLTGTPPIDFLPVDHAKTGKNRLHVDLRPDDQAAEVARLEALGATRVDVGQGDDVPWVVLADPEGNELCVLAAEP